MDLIDSVIKMLAQSTFGVCSVSIQFLEPFLKTITQWFLECFPEEFPLTSHFPEEYNTVYILPTALSLPHPNVLL